MNILKTCLTVAAVLSALAAHGRPPEAPRTASVSLSSRSIRLSGAQGASSLAVFFSSASIRSSSNGELKPSTARPGFYEANYAVFENAGGTLRPLESGTVFLAIPAGDADNDTVPDPADFDSSVSVTLAGEAVPRGASAATRLTQQNFSVQLIRSAGEDSGTYITDILPSDPLGGVYTVYQVEGTVEYRRTDNGAFLNFSLPDYAPTNAHGISRILDSNSVRIAAFRLYTGVPRPARIGPALLTRTGNVYRGEVGFSDGVPDTAAADFRSWVIQITDTNDANANGVPEFSDVLAPYIVVQPRRQIVDVGGKVTLSVVVSGTGPFTFFWEQNGHGISSDDADPTARVLVIPNAGDADRGSYRVRVTNAAGSVYSDSTSVSLR